MEGDVRAENGLGNLEVSCAILAHFMLSGRAFSSLTGAGRRSWLVSMSV